MFPRKRHRPNPSTSTASSMTGDTVINNDSSDSAAGPDPASSTTSLPVPQLKSSESTASSDPRKEASASQATQRSTKQIRKARSWYESWPAPPKAVASTSVARENILGGSIRSKRQSNLSQFDTKRDSDSSSVHSTATRTGVDPPKIPDDMSRRNNEAPKPAGEADKGEEQGGAGSKPVESNSSESAPSEPIANGSKGPEQAEVSDQQKTPTTQQPAPSSGWLGWWNRPLPAEAQSAPEPPAAEDGAKADEGAKTDDVEMPNAPPTEAANSEAPHPDQPTSSEAAEPPMAQTEQPAKPPSTTSWFGLWGAAKKPQGDTVVDEANKPSETEQQAASEDAVMEDAPPADAPQNETQPATAPAASSESAPTPAPAPAPKPKAGSTWAFWSKDSSKTKGTPVQDKAESGEIAVIGEGSESHPAPMAEDSVSSPSEPVKEAPIKEVKESKGKLTWKKGKKSRPTSVDLDNSSQTPSRPSTPQESTTKTDTKPDSSSKSIAESISATRPNLLLPSFSSTYQMKENPSIIKQIRELLLGSSQLPPNHVYRVGSPPKIRKAIAIGIHGFFPATYLRTVIGQPTGTSLRFANLCADAIRRWADANGSSVCEIEKVALEGEGKINERVDNLWKLMLNWIDHIRSADLILIASHSQGVPVSIMLLEKLIDLGIVTNAKIGVCAMAGVSLGPFPEYKVSLLGASANELWEFGNPQSQNSQKLETALKKVLDFGARITFIGSIDDQLVPLDSALYAIAHHPYIYRAVFIDGRTHAPDFIAHLVGFALKLRNLGISDHGLIRELSLPLAGSLYSGEGHSRLYYEAAVYDLAVSHCLETTPAARQTPPCTIRRPLTATSSSSSSGNASGSGAPSNQSNPYVLPWIMRGLLEEDMVKTDLSEEAQQLLRQFDDWKPSTKPLKDVKYRLEAVRSKL